jgi:hypothetical protein
MSKNNDYEGGSPMDSSSQFESELNLSSEQSGGGMFTNVLMLGFIVYCCLTMIMSIIMIFIINSGNHCKNRGKK